MTPRILTLALATLVASATGARADGRFQVEPTRVDLAPDAPTAAVIVTNEGSEPLRLQLTAMRWRENVDGGMQLDAAPDVIVRPALVEIPAGGQRPIRVGLTTTTGAIEGSFRVFVEELPDRRPASGGRIQVLTRVGVPVFVAPRQIQSGVRVAAAMGVAGGVGGGGGGGGGGATVVVTVEDVGTVHVKVATVQVTAVDRAGAVAWRHEVQGWYVLAGAARRFVVGVGRDGCPAGGSLTAEVVDEDGAQWSSPPVPCER